MANFSINLILNSFVSSKSISGGDRISIELCKGWQRRGHPIRLFVCQAGHYLCQRDKFQADYHIISNFSTEKWGLFLAYTLRILKAFFFVPKVKGPAIIFSSSDFLTDTIPAYRMKRKNKSTKWISGFYLVAPNPFQGETSWGLRSFLYFFTQRFSIYLMRKYADAVFVLNEEDKRCLEKRKIPIKKIKVVSGGVDLKGISQIKTPESHLYDGCFVGRFHQQKGILDLIEIWESVVRKREHTRLAIIGWGSRKQARRLKEEIKNKRLEGNIDLLGPLDGEEKIEILKSSKVFLFPSHYESWGVAACEAMACGLPVVAYDLSIFKKVFLQGMRAVPLGKTEEFAKNVLDLLENKEIYKNTREEALRMASRYDWKWVANNALSYLNYRFKEEFKK